MSTDAPSEFALVSSVVAEVSVAVNVWVPSAKVPLVVTEKVGAPPLVPATTVPVSADVVPPSAESVIVSPTASPVPVIVTVGRAKTVARSRATTSTPGCRLDQADTVSASRSGSRSSTRFVSRSHRIVP